MIYFLLSDLHIFLAYGPQGRKKFKHFHVERTHDNQFLFGGRRFASLPDVLKHFVERNDFKLIPYFVERTQEWNDLLTSIGKQSCGLQI